MEEQNQNLAQQLQQRNEAMTAMKARIAEFVSNLKDEHAATVRSLQDDLAQKDEVMFLLVVIVVCALCNFIIRHVLSNLALLNMRRPSYLRAIPGWKSGYVNVRLLIRS
jgi:hypothetical protein